VKAPLALAVPAGGFRLMKEHDAPGTRMSVQAPQAGQAMTPASVYCSICGKKMKYEGVIPRAGFADAVPLFSCECGHTQLDNSERDVLQS
jgi:hypothetical protein